MDQENPLMVKLRELLLKGNPAVTTDVDEANAASRVEPSTDTVKTMAEGGEVPPTDLDGIREMLKKVSQDNKPEPAKNIHVDLTKPDLDANNKTTKGVFMTQRFAEGGKVEKPTTEEPKAPKGPSPDEKREAVMKAIKEKSMKLDDGGVIDPSQLPMSPDAPQDSKLQAILKAMGMAGSNIMNSPAGKIAGAFVNPLGAVSDLAQSKPIQNIVGQEAKAIAPAVGAMAGMPPTPDVPPAAQAPATPPPQASPAPAPAPMHSAAPASPTPDPLSELGKFDPSTVTPGLNPQDRQSLAGTLDKNQHSFGNYLAEAIAGLGDAVAAKGGVRQNALGDIFSLQTQQRHEALENFDKARSAAVEHFTMKNQADQALINNLKARNEMYVSPAVAHMIGHPDLAGKPLNQADLVVKTDAMKYDYANKMTERKQTALKNAAEEADKALQHGGMFGTQKMMDPKSRLNFIHAQAIKNDPEAFGYKVQ